MLLLKLSHVFTYDEQAKKNKKLFWVAAIAPLTSVIVSTIFVYITRADKKGVSIVSIKYRRIRFSIQILQI